MYPFVSVLKRQILNYVWIFAFLTAFQKFISRRGEPHTIRFDNGTNLVGRSKILEEAWHQLAFDIEGDIAPKTDRVASQPCQNQSLWRVIQGSGREPEGICEASAFHIQFHVRQLYIANCSCKAILDNWPLYPLTDNSQDFKF